MHINRDHIRSYPLVDEREDLSIVQVQRINNKCVQINLNPYITISKQSNDTDDVYRIELNHQFEFCLVIVFLDEFAQKTSEWSIFSWEVIWLMIT